MAIVSGLCASYKIELLENIHALSDTYMIALYTSQANLDPSTTVYTSVGEVSGGNYPAGGITIPNAAAIQDLNVAILTFSNTTFLDVTIPDLRGALIYNASKQNKAVAVFDFGSSQSLITTDLKLVVPPANATYGLIRFN